MPLQSLLLDYLWYAIFPLWLVVGLGDYLCHRRTRIEATSGFTESSLHFLQMLQIAIPFLAVLFFEINRLVLAIAVVGVLLHTATFWWDVQYTMDKRRISVAEQFVHCFLVTIPLFVVSLLIMLYWPHDRSWSLQLKAEPVPSAQVLFILGCVAALNLLPLLEEVWRTRRDDGGTLRGSRA
jgi:hypothetical protein